MGRSGLIAAGCVTAALICGSCASPDTLESAAPDIDRHLQGPGTPLRDGLEVTMGTALVGAVSESVPWNAENEAYWSGVLLVEGDPLTAWRSFLDQFPTALNPQLAPSGPVGCSLEGTDGLGPGCGTYAIGGSTAERLPFYVQLTSTPGTVTGRYMIQINVEPGGVFRGDMIRPGRAVESGLTFPEITDVRPRPGVGDVLAPDVEDRYALLPGTEFVALYGPGSGTGGFDVVLRVVPGADLERVLDDYAAQATQEPGSPDGTVRGTERVGDTTYTTLYPPPAAGGDSAYIDVVDQPGDDADYIYYTVAHD